MKEATQLQEQLRKLKEEKTEFQKAVKTICNIAGLNIITEQGEEQ